MKSIFKRIIVAILTFEAKLLLKRTRPTIVAITGNVGKTSVKDAAYAVLRGRVHARKSEKSYNSDIGVPLSILGLTNAWQSPVGWAKNIFDGLIIALFPGSYPKVLVLEMGVDRPGDMERLTRWIHPNVVVLTRLPDVPVHVEYFDSPEAVVAEKRHLIDALREDGVLIFNQDDERVATIAGELRQKTVGYSRYSLSDFTGSSDKVIYEHGRAVGLEFVLTHGKESTLVRMNGSLGIQHVYNLAAAAAVGSVFGISIQDAAGALAEHAPPPGRMRLLSGIKDTLIIDDSYNSSPEAARRALQTLKELKGVKRRIAVLGDMLELGQYSIDAHKEIGAAAAEAADVLITVGVRARGFAAGALSAGMDEKNIFQYDESLRAGRELQNMLEEGDVVLIKGSQSIRTERVAEEIMAEPEKAPDLLVRQSSVWRGKM
jgi:UDP-N-acetylmuramoyl-tripeptide--D-alanyl-D-alanine ligase